MSSKPYKLSIDTVAKRVQGSTSVNYDVDAIASFSAVVMIAELLDGFDRVQIERDDVEIFDGRIEKPRITFGSAGTTMPISGFDWTARLKDFLTPSQSIVDATTADALTAILSETDFATTVVGTFSYITELQDWDTSIEMCMTIPTYNNSCIEYDLTDIELQSEAASAITIADFGKDGNNNCFFYDGPTERFYVFWRDTGNNIWYAHSTDGIAWTKVDTTFNCTSFYWTVDYYGGKVHLINLHDHHLGTITDATGTIGAWVNTLNVYVNAQFFGPVWDDDDHLWIIDHGGNAFESTDNGLTFNSRINPAADHFIWAVMPEGNDGDMVTVVCDELNDDLEEWFWDRSAGTHTYVGKIETTNGVIDHLDASMSDDYGICIAWGDGGNSYHAYRVASNNWTVANMGLNTTYLTISCDGAECSYVFINATTGFTALKYRNGVLDTTFRDSTVPWHPSGLHIGGCRAWKSGGDVAVFGSGEDDAGDLWFFIFDPQGIRLNRGDTTGNFLTDTINASGSFVSWGTLTADGIGLTNGVDVLWDIEDAATVVLADDQTAPFDLDIAGVDPSETAIKIHCYLDDNGTDPYVYEFDITEKTDAVSFDNAYEDCYVGVRKLADLAGAEFYVTYDGTTWTVIFTTRRGIDKSDTLILKTALTADEPDTKANVKVLNKMFDWSNYANAVIVVGGTDADGDPSIGVVRDNAEIESMGQEYWIRISDGDIVSTSMARQRALVELEQRNAVVIRMSGEFIDKYPTGAIEIGDSVTLISEWNDGALKVSGSNRIVTLNRTSGVGGETVTADFSNRMKSAQFWNYMKLTDDHGRWITG